MRGAWIQGVDLSRALSLDDADRHDRIPIDGDVSNEGLGAGSVYDESAANHQIMGHEVSPVSFDRRKNLATGALEVHPHLRGMSRFWKASVGRNLCIQLCELGEGAAWCLWSGDAVDGTHSERSTGKTKTKTKTEIGALG